jgi:mRNA interferase RelE/StbE
MKINLNYSKAASKFFDKNLTVISEGEVDDLLIYAVKIIFKKETINLDLKALKGNLKGYYRIRKGNVRIVFSTDKKNDSIIVNIKNIDYRGSIYNK